MELLNSSLTKLPTDSGFFRPSASVGDHYMLKEKFEGLEYLLASLEQLLSAKVEQINQKGREMFELQVFMLRAALESARRLVSEYSNTVDIETNFTTRLSQCEKRANKIFETFNQIRREFINQKMAMH
jgi:hypothetical protein